MVARTRRIGWLAMAAALAFAPAFSAEPLAAQARPRALAYDAEDGLLYVALSTTDEVGVVDPRGPAPRLVARLRTCRFPGALAALPGGGALVACRFDAGLRRVTRAADGRWRVTTLPAGTESGARGLALAPGGRVAYVASPATSGVKVVAL